MTLRTKLLIVTAAAVLGVLGVSEWFSYSHTLRFVQHHEQLMASETDHRILLSRLQSEAEQLRFHLFSLHLAHAALTVAALGAVLTVLWYRLVLRPLRVLLAHMRQMERGGGWTAIQGSRHDEIGELYAGFNRLCERLTFAMFQSGVAAKLSSMALLSRRVLRDALVTRDQVLSVALMLETGQPVCLATPNAAAANLRAAAERLEQMRESFEAEFERELRRYKDSEESIKPKQQTTLST